MTKTRTNYDLDTVFRNWYMDLLENKESIENLIQDKAIRADIIFSISAVEVPTMTISVEKVSY